MTVRIMNADVMEGLAQFVDESVHCVVTSPPYWGLRDYGFDGQIGREATMQEHIDKIVAVFREVRRVLRKDGTLWLNYGDAYAGSWGAQSRGVEENDKSTLGGRKVIYSGAGAKSASHTGSMKRTPGLKPKDLMMMPARVALALQADGWWLRKEIIWHKPNPMPESCSDRPTSSHEKIYLLTKAERYHYDAEAVRERADYDPSRTKFPDGLDTGAGGHGSVHRNGREKGRQNSIGAKGNANGFRGGSYVNGEPGPRTSVGNTMPKEEQTASRNLRDVWTIACEPFPEAHFATFPTRLAELCLKAGTSEAGCCAKCGAARIRQIETSYDNPGNRTTNGARSLANRHETAGFAQRLERRSETLGFDAPCQCAAESVHCLVLDPFGGSGTVGVVADRLGLNAILIEGNPEYVGIARRRLARDRLARKKGTMADVAEAKLEPTPIERLLEASA